MADPQSEREPIDRGDTITVGDISGSIAAIGAGAQVVYNNIERALSEVEVEEQAARAERERLAQSLRTYIERLHRQSERAAEITSGASPYRALLSYDFGDAALFYGRGRAVGGLLDHLGRSPLTILHADSGAGKTSLLRAGIMPRLLAAGDVPLYIRPYQTPAHYAIKRGLIVQLEQTPELRLASLHDFLRHTSNLLGEHRLVILLDQFEELFTYQRREQRDDFIEELATCLDDDTLPVSWLFSLRGEWFTQLGTFRPHIKSPFANEYLLQALSADEAREVITAPAKLVGVSYEDRLLDTLITDLGDQAIAPPQLQLVCSALFETRDEGQSTITSESYSKLGGTRGILRSHLDRVMSRHVPPDQRAVARQILEALVSSDRRRILRTEDDLSRELQALGIERLALSEVLPVLIDSRLLRVEEIEEAPDSAEIAYELAHDYLIEEIELDPATQSRKAAQELLEQQVEIYRRHKTLLGADELVILEAQGDSLVVGEEGRQLIEASQQKLKRERRIFAVGIGAVVILLGLAVFSVLAALGAAVARQDAEAAEAAAERRIDASRVAIEQLFAERGKIQLGGTPEGIVWDGTAIWVSILEDNRLYRVESGTGVVDLVVELPPQAHKLFWDGEWLWAITLPDERGAVNAIHQIDPQTGDILQSITVGARPEALYSDGTRAWVVTIDDQTIQRVDIEAGQVVDGASLGAQPTDIIPIDGLLWITTNAGEILLYDPEVNRIIDRLPVGNGRHLGPMAFDGQSLWVASQPGSYIEVDVASRRADDPRRLPGLDQPGANPSGIPSVIWDGASIWISTVIEGAYTGSALHQIDPENGEIILTSDGPDQIGLGVDDPEIGYGAIASGAGSDIWMLDTLEGALLHLNTRSLNFIGTRVDLTGRIDDPDIAAQGRFTPTIEDITHGDLFVWVADSTSEHVFRLNDFTLELEEPIPYGTSWFFSGDPQIAWSFDRVWAAPGFDPTFYIGRERPPGVDPEDRIEIIDSETGELVGRFENAFAIGDMVWGGNSLWVSRILNGIDRFTGDGQLIEHYPMSSPGSVAWTGNSLIVSDLGSYTLEELDPDSGTFSTFAVIGGCGASAFDVDLDLFWISSPCASGIAIHQFEGGELGPVLGYIDVPGGACMRAIQSSLVTVMALDCDGQLWTINHRSLRLVLNATP